MKKISIAILFILISLTIQSQSYLRFNLGGRGFGAMPEIDPNAFQYSYETHGLQHLSLIYTKVLNSKNAISGSIHYNGGRSVLQSTDYRWPSEYSNGVYAVDSTLPHNYIQFEEIRYVGIGVHSNFLLFRSFENLSIQSSLKILYNTSQTKEIGFRESNRFKYQFEPEEKIDLYNKIFPLLELDINYAYRLGKLLGLPILNRVGIEISFGMTYTLRDIKNNQSNFANITRHGMLGLSYRLGPLNKIVVSSADKN